VGVDECHGLPEIDRQVTRHEAASVIADDADLDRSRGNLRGECRTLVVTIVRALIVVASTPTAAASPGVVIVIIVTGILRECLPERSLPRGAKEEQTAGSRDSGLESVAPGAGCGASLHVGLSSVAQHDRFG
jgi:hypothetical protein